MPKSKRSQVVSLTNTQKKGRPAKDSLISQIRECCQSFPFIHIFSVENMRTSSLQTVRAELGDGCRIFMGKNKVMAVALGLTKEDEILPGSSQLSSQLTGNNVGILFADKDADSLNSYFSSFTPVDYARTGSIAAFDVTVEAGPLYRGGEPFPHSLESQARALGMPTNLKKGIVSLNDPYVICKEGDVLTSEQARLLKLFLVPMSTFKISIVESFAVPSSN